MADLVFKINGADYPTGDISEFISSFTIDECGVYHQWTGALIEDIEEASVSSLMIAAFMQIAYMRGNPTLSAQAARKAIGESNLGDALSSFNAAAEGDAGPPDQRPSEPVTNGSPGNRPVSLRSSGEDSMTPSAPRTSAHSPGGSPPWVPSVTSGSATSAH